jgi:hypothetical protein
LVVLVVVCGCGRIDFDPLGAGSAASSIGCSDGQREAFVDLVAFPTIAGCGATWAGMPDLRSPTTGAACGDDLGACAVPADACAAGWHMCGTSGDVRELLVVTAPECLGEQGVFVAASSTCQSAVPSCTYPAPGAFPCTGGKAIPCSQPICCGNGCLGVGCPDGVWAGMTTESTISYGCGDTPVTGLTGVLCCQ